VAGLIKFLSPVSRAGLSTCPGPDLPGQLDGLLRTPLPGKTVTGHDPASLDRLDFFQRANNGRVFMAAEFVRQGIRDFLTNWGTFIYSAPPP
jgi:hypothetical protein